MDLLADLPGWWKHDIEVVESPGRDLKGNPQPGTKTVISGCLLAVADTSDLDNLNSDSTLRGRVFIPKGHKVSSTARIVTLSPAPVVGRWAVDGEPIYWPHGTEVRVEWEGNV